MEMNVDCIRSVLLVLEANLKVQWIKGRITFHPISWRELEGILELSEFSQEDIIYALVKLREAGYIRCIVEEKDNYMDKLSPYDITYEGHEFLRNVKEDQVWSTIKKVIEKVGSTSLTLIAQHAATLALQKFGVH